MYSLDYIFFSFLYFFYFYFWFISLLDLNLRTVQRRVELDFYLCYFLLKITAWKFMKSRKNFGIHFFSVLLQLQWLYVIGAPFLKSQCSNRSTALLDFIYI